MAGPPGVHGGTPGGSIVSFLSLCSAKLHTSGGWFPAHPGVQMTVALIIGSWTAVSVAAGLVFGKAVHQADLRELESVS